jgi:flagellar hook-associated protein 1
MGSALDAFQASMQELASRPNDMSVREQVLGNANNVATAFQNASAGLDQAHADANERIRGGVDEVNQRLRQVGSLSAQINKAEITGNEASDLRDQRDVLVREIAERVPVTVVEQGSTGFSLTLGGSQSLVSPEGKVSELTVTDVNGDARITKKAAGVEVDVTNLVSSGTVGGSIKARDGALKEMRTKVDQLAFDFANNYNTTHSAGVGLDGSGPSNVFVPPAGVAGAARNMAVSADVSGQPAKLAAALDVGSLPSDNRNAIALSNLSSARVATGGMSLSESLASMTARAGMAVQNANQAEAFSSGALDQVTALRDSMSGVNSDEEMVSMMRYQQAYSASLQVISVADQMLGELMNLRR